MKKQVLVLLPIMLLAITSCTSRGNDKSDSSDTESEPITQESTDQNEPSTEDSSTEEVNSNYFGNIKINQEKALYHTDGGFMLNVCRYKDKDGGYTLNVSDYSLGDFGVGFNNGVLDESGDTLTYKDVKVELQNGVPSEFFPSSKHDIILIHNVENNTLNVKIAGISYTLVENEVERRYYLNPEMVGDWENKDAGFSISISKDKTGESIILKEGSNELKTSNYVHSEFGTTVNIDTDGTLFKKDTTLFVGMEEDSNNRYVEYKSVKYPLTKVVEEIDDVIDNFFSFNNLANGKILKYEGLELKAATPMGDIGRWFKLTEGEVTNKDTKWDMEQNMSIARYTCDIPNKTGYIKEGVSYKMYAKEIDGVVKVVLIGNDNTEIHLSAME